MNKLLCIVGPTATGKTARAIEEAEKTPSIIVSADSRQVYRGMDIVTGKDHPEGITIKGIDIVDPNEACSVAVWHDAVMPHIQHAWELGKQVIVVGGTGLYVRALTDGIETMRVPINPSLRNTLSQLSIAELQTKLVSFDPTKFASMNHSDQNNSRRLIRAIEIALNPHRPAPIDYRPSTKVIGLRYYDYSNYSSKIRDRVLNRLKGGAVEETKKLLSQYAKSLQSMSAIGYGSIIKFLDDEISKQEMIDTWIRDELSYAKRQLTWFTKVKSIQWYDKGKGHNDNTNN